MTFRDSPPPIHAHGRTLTVRKTAAGSYVLRVEGSSRVRFGNGMEALADVAHFQATGALPAPSPEGGF